MTKDYVVQIITDPIGGLTHTNFKYLWYVKDNGDVCAYGKSDFLSVAKRQARRAIKKLHKQKAAIEKPSWSQSYVLRNNKLVRMGNENSTRIPPDKQ